MSKIIIQSGVVMEILNREIPKLFSKEGNSKYQTSAVDMCFIDDDGDELFLSDWHVEIREYED